MLAALASGGGQALDGRIRRDMETRLGEDFSAVRVLTDRAAVASAAAVRARAYTIGDDVVFGAGAYAPETSEGRRTLAHELVHVKQQRRGPVAGTNVGYGIVISDPRDSFEREAELLSDRALRAPAVPANTAEAGSPAVASMASSASPGHPLLDRQGQTGNRAVATGLRVQRYQWGEFGHGGIEEDALKAAGFSGSMTEGEIGAVYFGNWLRDFSQIPTGGAKGPAAMAVLNVLSMGLFNRPVTAEDLGGYLPSEHMDNPLGGGTIEDTSATSKTEAGLSSAQKQWVGEEGLVGEKGQDVFKQKMAHRADQTHLPAYVEVGKQHARQELRRAAEAGRNPEGMMALGNGLHAIEDYFAHSNFADACVYMLASEGKNLNGSHVLQGLQARAKQFGYDPSGGVAAGKARPEIRTGTDRDAGNKAVSLLESLKTEVVTGSLAQAAVRGCIRLGWVQGGQAGGKAGRAVAGAIGGVIGGVGGAVGGAVTGAGQGAAKGWREGHGVGKVFAAIGGLFTGAASGAAKGASSGWRSGTRVGGDIGQNVGTGIGEVVGGVGTGAIALVVGLLVKAIELAARPAFLAVEAPLGTWQTKKAAEASGAPKAKDPRQPRRETSHSELAKDATDHPAFALSRALAVEADTRIGKAMVRAWESHASEETIQELFALVDTLVSNPHDNGWWRPKATEVLLSRH